MPKNNKSYRINTATDGSLNSYVLPIKLDRDYNMIEILSLKMTQEETYRFHTSNYGVVVGRVLANQGVGIQNAKISIFIPATEETRGNMEKFILYPFENPHTKDRNGTRYNLLPSQQIDECHQNVGLFFSKRLVLDDNTVLEVFEDYYKYTTTSNQAGDYMIYGVPTGDHQMNIDIDLSDIGMFSQKPTDMMFQGFNIESFDSSSQFKNSTNLDSLVQIINQVKSVYVHPFWGEASEGEIGITRCDVDVAYNFQPTCIFLGSVFTDGLDSAVLKNCRPQRDLGLARKLRSGKGTIEMIRKTFDGGVENFQIKGNELINGDGVWCYQIPMNLNYVKTDELGNLVPSDNPNVGIPTKTTARFKITLNNSGESKRNTASYLVPHNPEDQSQIDYSLDERTQDESFRDLIWNKVYTVKGYIPRMQLTANLRSRLFTGLKTINDHGTNNPPPFNNIHLRLPLGFILFCAITGFVIRMTAMLNEILSTFVSIFCWRILGLSPMCGLVSGIRCVSSGSDWCDRFSGPVFVNCFGRAIQSNTIAGGDCRGGGNDCVFISGEELRDCVSSQLAVEYNVMNFDFYNDWMNGSLYMPQFQIKRRRKRRRRFFGLFGTRVTTNVTRFCGGQENGVMMAQDGGFFRGRGYRHNRLREGCSIAYGVDGSGFTFNINNERNNNCRSRGRCDFVADQKRMNSSGLVNMITNDHGEPVDFYYTPCAFHGSETFPTFIHATDMVLLGSLSSCDKDNIPPMHQYLTGTSFNYPPNTRETTPDGNDDTDEGNSNIEAESRITEMTGADWGGGQNGFSGNLSNSLGDLDVHRSGTAGGLFFGVNCFGGGTIPKSCINVSRICEIGVSLDECFDNILSCNRTERIIPDGLIGIDELEDVEVRQMFSTLNLNKLHTKPNTSEYAIEYNYPTAFDGRLSPVWSSVNEHDRLDMDYIKFRMGNLNPNRDNGITRGIYYNENNRLFSFPRYVNSYYFFFGLNIGNTAIDVFNSTFYTPCIQAIADPFTVIIADIINAIACPCVENPTPPSFRFIVRDSTNEFRFVVIDLDSRNNVVNETMGVVNTNILVTLPLGSGEYQLIIEDDNNQTVRRNINIRTVGRLTFDLTERQPIGDTTTIAFNDDLFSPTIQTRNHGFIFLNNIGIPNNSGCGISDFKIQIERCINTYIPAQPPEEFGRSETTCTSLEVGLDHYSDSFRLTNGEWMQIHEIEIPLPHGGYTITLIKNDNCPDSAADATTLLRDPEELQFFMNRVNVARTFLGILSLTGSDADIWRHTTNYWLEIYSHLFVDPTTDLEDRMSTTRFRYPIPQDIPYEERNGAIIEFNQNIMSFLIKISPHDLNLLLSAEYGNPPYMTYLVGHRSDPGGTTPLFPPPPPTIPGNIFSHPRLFDLLPNQISPYYTHETIFFGVFDGMEWCDNEDPNDDMRIIQTCHSGLQVSVSGFSATPVNNILVATNNDQEMIMGGYYTALMDLNGFGKSVPMGLYENIDDASDNITLLNFNTLKRGSTAGIRNSIFFHVFDKELREVRERRRNVSYVSNYWIWWSNDPSEQRTSPNGQIDIFYHNGTDELSMFDSNGNFIPFIDEIYRGDFAELGTNILSIPSIRRIRTSTLEVPEQPSSTRFNTPIQNNFSLLIQDDIHDSSLTITNNLNLRSEFSSTMNINNDGYGTMTLTLTPRPPIWGVGVAPYTYFLISTNDLSDTLNGWQNANSPQRVIREFYTENVSTFPAFTTSDRFLNTSFPNNITTNSQTATFTEIGNNIHYSIIVDGNGDRVFTQPVDMRTPLNVSVTNHTNVTLTYNANMYSFGNVYRYDIVQGTVSNIGGNTGWTNVVPATSNQGQTHSINLPTSVTNDPNRIIRFSVTDIIGHTTHSFISMYRMIINTEAITCDDMDGSTDPLLQQTYSNITVEWGTLSGSVVTLQTMTHSNLTEAQIVNLAPNGNLITLPICD